MPLLCGLHIPKEILFNHLNLCKIGQRAGFVAVAGVHPLIHGLYLQVITALSLIFLPLNQDISTFLFLSSIMFTTIVFNCHCNFIYQKSSFVNKSTTVNHQPLPLFVNTVFLWNSVPLHILNDLNPKSFRHSLYHYIQIDVFVPLHVCNLICLLYFCSCSVLFVADTLYRLCFCVCLHYFSLW